VASLSSLKNSDRRRVWQQLDKDPADERRDFSTRADQERNNNRADGSLPSSRFQPRRSFPYPWIRLQSDRRFPNQKQTETVIKQYIRLEERLSILRSEDQFRQWQSLDDKRFCILCERTFDGRQVDIRGSSGGRFRLHCPTEDCSSTPQHWVRPGNPLVSDKAYQDWSVALSVPKKTAASSSNSLC
jgi:hypothetical protein